MARIAYPSERLYYPQCEIDERSGDQRDDNACRAVSIIVVYGSTRTDSESAVQEHAGGPSNSDESDDRERDSASEADSIVFAGEVEQAHADGTEEDGELEPCLQTEKSDDKASRANIVAHE